MESLKSLSIDCLTKQELLERTIGFDVELENIQRMIEAESEMANESIEDVEEN